MDTTVLQVRHVAVGMLLQIHLVLILPVAALVVEWVVILAMAPRLAFLIKRLHVVRQAPVIMAYLVGQAQQVRQVPPDRLVPLLFPGTLYLAHLVLPVLLVLRGVAAAAAVVVGAGNVTIALMMLAVVAAAVAAAVTVARAEAVEAVAVVRLRYFYLTTVVEVT